MNANSSRRFDAFSEHRSEASLAHELPYWDFMDNIVVLADGTLATGLKLQGLAIETWDSDAINRTVMGLRALLNSLPDGCEISFVSDVNTDCTELIDRHAKLKGKNPLTAWVADHRIIRLREDSESLSLLRPTLYAFVYRRFDPLKKTGSLSMLRSFFSSPRSFQATKRDEHEVASRDLGQTVVQLRERLESYGITSTPMTAQDSWRIIYSFINPGTSQSAPKPNSEHRTQEFIPAELEKVPELSLPSPREQLCGSDLIQGYDSFYLDGLYHRVLTLKTLPEQTHSALIARVSGLPFPHGLYVHVRVPEQSKELSSLQARRRMAHSMSATQGGRASDLESEARLQSTEELLRELIQTGQKIFYFQCAVLIRAADRETLEARTKTVLSAFRELGGAEGLAETVAGFKVWKTLLPLGTTATVRPKRVKTDNLADFLPLYEPYSGTLVERERPVCLFRNRQSGLVAYDPYNSNLPNYNTLVTGSSGAGKSFINNLVLLQYMTQNPMLYLIDIGGSYRKLCEFMGGQYIELTPPRAGEATKVINPFELPEGNTEPSPQKIKFLLALLETILTDNEGDRLPKLDKSLLEECILSLYQRTPGEAPTLSDLAALFTTSPDEKLRQFARMLYPWTGERPYGRLLDGKNELKLSGDFVAFDLKGLSSYPDLQSVMILILTDFILGRVESKDPAVQARRKQILMDECWALLKGHTSAQFMEYCVRTLRKTGSGITFITQGLEEVVASPIGGALLANTATKFILMQRGDLEPIRQILKFNEQEMALIRSLRQAKGRYSEAFLVANEARTVIRAVPTPVEYWLATSDAADNALLTAVRFQFPEKTLAESVYWLSLNFPEGSQGVTQIPERFIQEKGGKNE